MLKIRRKPLFRATRHPHSTNALLHAQSGSVHGCGLRGQRCGSGRQTRLERCQHQSKRDGALPDPATWCHRLAAYLQAGCRCARWLLDNQYASVQKRCSVSASGWSHQALVCCQNHRRSGRSRRQMQYICLLMLHVRTGSFAQVTASRCALSSLRQKRQQMRQQNFRLLLCHPVAAVVNHATPHICAQALQ